jgi:hypothetical protein
MKIDDIPEGLLLRSRLIRLCSLNFEFSFTLGIERLLHIFHIGTFRVIQRFYMLSSRFSCQNPLALMTVGLLLDGHKKIM